MMSAPAGVVFRHASRTPAFQVNLGLANQAPTNGLSIHHSVALKLAKRLFPTRIELMRPLQVGIGCSQLTFLLVGQASDQISDGRAFGAILQGLARQAEGICAPALLPLCDGHAQQRFGLLRVHRKRFAEIPRGIAALILEQQKNAAVYEIGDPWIAGCRRLGRYCLIAVL